MQRAMRVLTVLVLALSCGILATAGEKKKPAAPPDPAAGILKRLEKAELTADQVAQIKELFAKNGDKLKAANEKLNLTPEQKKARAETAKKAQEEGKKGPEVQAAVEAAMQLTDAQKAALKELQQLQGELSKQAFAVLTDEQKAKAEIKTGGKRGGRKQ